MLSPTKCLKIEWTLHDNHQHVWVPRETHGFSSCVVLSSWLLVFLVFGEGGMLTEAVRQRPYSVVLADEVEKTDGPQPVLSSFRQRHTEWWRRSYHRWLQNTLIIMTSNLATHAKDWVFGSPSERHWCQYRHEGHLINIESTLQTSLTGSYPCCHSFLLLFQTQQWPTLFIIKLKKVSERRKATTNWHFAMVIT